VGGLRDNITDSELRAYFEKFGTMNDAVVMIDKWTKRSRGFGFVTFDSDESVRKVMATPFHELNGRTVEVKIAVPKCNHSNNTSDTNNYNNESECDNGDGCYVPRMFDARGSPAFGAYFGGVYPPYGRFFNGYAAAPMPPYIYPGNYSAAVGNYASIGYGGFRSPWVGGPGMMARRSPVISGMGAYFGYMNNGGGVLGGYMGANGNGAYYGNMGIEDGMKMGCTDSDVSSTAVNGVTAVVPQLEAVKLDAQ
jgi:RNA-binding protein Musashi